MPEVRPGERLGEGEAAKEGSEGEQGQGEKKKTAAAGGGGRGDATVWTLERARGSTLALTNLRYPGVMTVLVSFTRTKARKHANSRAFHIHKHSIQCAPIIMFAEPHVTRATHEA